MTASSANSAAFDPGASAVSGSARGVVVAGHTEDVPLQGPGAWVLSASAPVASRLACPRANASVANQIVIANAQTCQLTITSTSRATTAWQLAFEP